MHRLVIKYEFLSRPLKVLLAALTGFGLMFSGFMIGVLAATAPVDGLPQTIIIPVPEAETNPHPFMPGTFGEPVLREASNWEYDSIKQEIKCLADNMYFEGRNQTTHGKIGIGLATINRVKSKHFKNNICDVVWFKARDRRTGKMTAHFSWTLDGKSDKIANKPVYQEIYRIAEAMIAEGSLDNFYDFTEGATHYHADYVTPYWASEMMQIAQIDDHIYYRP